MPYHTPHVLLTLIEATGPLQDTAHRTITQRAATMMTSQWSLVARAPVECPPCTVSMVADVGETAVDACAVVGFPKCRNNELRSQQRPGFLYALTHDMRA